MKRLIFATLMAMFCLGMHAQKKEKPAKFEETQARLIDMTANAYVKPMTVELSIHGVTSSNPSPRATEFSYLFPANEVAALGNDLANIKSKALYLMCAKFQADAIVGARFNVTAQDVDIKNGCTVEIIGWPADFVKWKTAEKDDLEWMQLDLNRKVTDLEHVRAVTNVSAAGVVTKK